MEGLLSNKSAPLTIKESTGRGRGVFAAALIGKREYITEYKGEVYSRSALPQHQREYSRNDEGCYVLEVQLPDGQGWICIDATRRYNC